MIELAPDQHGAYLDPQSVNVDLETCATQGRTHGDQALSADVIDRFKGTQIEANPADSNGVDMRHVCLQQLGALPAEHASETESHAIPQARCVGSDQELALGAASTVIGHAPSSYPRVMAGSTAGLTTAGIVT